MSTEQSLARFFKEITDEVRRNPDFKRKLISALLPLLEHDDLSENSAIKRPSNRRSPAVIDPIQISRNGEDTLLAELSKLDIEQLRDIVAQYGMDTGKLVMKWRDRNRVIERIMDVAKSRAHKGSAFRDHAVEETSSDQPD